MGQQRASTRGEARLAPRTGEILAYIRRTQSLLGAPPTVREIAAHFGIRSTNGVDYHLARLERQRLILRRRGRARGITLPAQPERSARGRRAFPDSRALPILGRIAAGGPLLAAENLEGSLDAGTLLRARPDFALRVQGESMRGAGILPGDLVLVQRDADPRDGEIVVALIGDEATVKRIYRERDRVVLRPENPDFEPIRIDESSPPLRLLGRVVGVYREMR